MNERSILAVRRKVPSCSILEALNNRRLTGTVESDNQSQWSLKLYRLASIVIERAYPILLVNLRIK